MPTAAYSTDSSLIVRVQARDPEAWQRLVDLYAPWIFAWTRRYGLAPADGADVTQETLLAVHRSIDQFRRESSGDSFRGWLWTILRNKIRDFHRRSQPAQGAGGTAAQLQLQAIPDALPEEFSDPQPAVAFTGLLHRGLAQVQSEFEPRTWQAFWMVVVEGRSPADVATALGISANSVRQAKSRILRRLRMELGEGPAEP